VYPETHLYAFPFFKFHVHVSPPHNRLLSLLTPRPAPAAGVPGPHQTKKRHVSPRPLVPPASKSALTGPYYVTLNGPTPRNLRTPPRTAPIPSNRPHNPFPPRSIHTHIAAHLTRAPTPRHPHPHSLSTFHSHAHHPLRNPTTNLPPHITPIPRPHNRIVPPPFLPHTGPRDGSTSNQSH